MITLHVKNLEGITSVKESSNKSPNLWFFILKYEMSDQISGLFIKYDMSDQISGLFIKYDMSDQIYGLLFK